jgi:hypothetical protein
MTGSTTGAHPHRHQYPTLDAFPMGGVSETRKAPSFEGASSIGSSHSLPGVVSATVFKTVAFVHSAISPYGSQPRHYRHENAC